MHYLLIFFLNLILKSQLILAFIHEIFLFSFPHDCYNLFASQQALRKRFFFLFIVNFIFFLRFVQIESVKWKFFFYLKMAEIKSGCKHNSCENYDVKNCEFDNKQLSKNVTFHAFFCGEYRTVH